MKKYNITIVITSLLIWIYLIAIHTQAMESVIKIEYIKAQEDFKNAQHEDVNVALEKAKNANEAITINAKIIFVLVLINMVTSIVSIINGRRITRS